MPNLVDVTYAQTGTSTNSNNMGMRAMQAKAFKVRNQQYILLKAPPASGKSRALMFLGLDKLINQGLKKVIVAVPERSIGASFAETNLTEFGFFADWQPNPRYNLCTPGEDTSLSKRNAFKNFMGSEEQILICTHATFRTACEELEDTAFDNCLIAIDEFHHVSADATNQLGDRLKGIIENSTAHLVAMTGSYFRGDSVPVLTPEAESKFTKVTYNYYEQLNGYTYLKSLGIGYHFYQGRYTSAIMEVLDVNKKTIIHIPSVNSGESTKSKGAEVGFIIDAIGETMGQDAKTGVISVKIHGADKILKIADLVEDNQKERDKIQSYLRDAKEIEDMDIIIALGMAKEGFDWPYCEHALTVGYRGSLTEIIQIIGRATRDSNNKTHAQFTNLIAQPDAANDDVKTSVNNMLKAITASLLMEQVLAPTWKFKTKKPDDEDTGNPKNTNTLGVIGLKKPSTEKVQQIIDEDLNDLKASILQNKKVQAAMTGIVDAETMNKVLIPKVIREKYPELSDTEVEEVTEHTVLSAIVGTPNIVIKDDQRFIKMADKFINIDELHIDLIDQVNPFQKAFEVISKSVDKKVLRIIQDTIQSTRIKMDWEEAKILWPKVQKFAQEQGREPSLTSSDRNEVRMAECIIYLKEEKRKRAEANG